MNVRLAKPEESGTAVEWLRSTPENLFDPEVLGYPSTMTLCVENGQPQFFIPIQLCLKIENDGFAPCLVLDSIGKRPGIRKREMAVALVSLIEAAKNLGKSMKVGEIYFVCMEKGIVEQAEKFGFERMMEDEKRGMVLFRMRTQCESTAT